MALTTLPSAVLVSRQPSVALITDPSYCAVKVSRVHCGHRAVRFQGRKPVHQIRASQSQKMLPTKLESPASTGQDEPAKNGQTSIIPQTGSLLSFMLRALPHKAYSGCTRAAKPCATVALLNCSQPSPCPALGIPRATEQCSLEVRGRIASRIACLLVHSLDRVKDWMCRGSLNSSLVCVVVTKGMSQGESQSKTSPQRCVEAVGNNQSVG